MKTLDLGLKNAELYAGCDIQEVGGRLSLMTPPAQAANIIGRNCAAMVEHADDRSAITLTGAMAVWAYLVVLHVVLHQFKQVWYDDGKGTVVQIAQH